MVLRRECGDCTTQLCRMKRPSLYLTPHCELMYCLRRCFSGKLANSVADCASWVGTVTYMSPERISGSCYSFDSDVWSLGLSMMECAEGRFPYTADCKGGHPLSFWDLLVRPPSPRPLSLVPPFPRMNIALGLSVCLRRPEVPLRGRQRPCPVLFPESVAEAANTVGVPNDDARSRGCSRSAHSRMLDLRHCCMVTTLRNTPPCSHTWPVRWLCGRITS
jgi:serine/threonine protein kinase